MLNKWEWIQVMMNKWMCLESVCRQISIHSHGCRMPARNRPENVRVNEAWNRGKPSMLSNVLRKPHKLKFGIVSVMTLPMFRHVVLLLLSQAVLSLPFCLVGIGWWMKSKVKRTFVYVSVCVHVHRHTWVLVHTHACTLEHLDHFQDQFLE